MRKIKDNDMKKYILIFLIFALLLPGCRGAETKGDIGYLADAKFDTDEYLPEYDYVNTRYYPHKISQVGNSLVYTLSGEKSMYFKYFDAESGEGGVLCNKPECTHANGSCNGYGMFFCVNYYDGSLWWMDTDRTSPGDYNRYLLRSDVSGANRRKVLKIYRHNIQNIYIHRGYAYLVINTNVVVGTESMTRTDLVAYALDGSGGEVTIYSNASNLGSSLKVIFVGNRVYCCLGVYSDKALEIYCFDTKTRTGGKIATIEKNDEFSPNGVYINRKNEIYLYGKVNKVATVWKYEDGKITEFVKFEDTEGKYTVRFMNDDVICAMSTSRVIPTDVCWVKKYDGTTVYKLNMESDYVDNTIRKDYAEVRGGRLFACGDENIFYIYGMLHDKDYGIYYIVMYEYDGEKIVGRLVDTDTVIYGKVY